MKGSSGATLPMSEWRQMADVRFTVSMYLCDSPVFLRWKKNHRKSRINKKWHKKYGAVYKPCPGKAYRMRGFGIVVCPCVAAAFEKKLAETEKRR
jgi:hypothetical protein